MNWFRWWKRTELDQDLQALEGRLQEALTPVAPRVEFVEGLRKNLLVQLSGVEITPQVQNQSLQTGLLITGGIVGSIFVVLAGIRGIVSLFGVAALLMSWLKTNMPQPSSSSDMAQ